MVFDDQWEYANEHLELLGVGSARSVFLLSSRYVLKMARGDRGFSFEKGTAQNEAEVDVYTDPRTKPIVTKIYDFDPKKYTWVVSELVRPLSHKEFVSTVGGEPDDIARAVEIYTREDYSLEAANNYLEKNIQNWNKKIEAAKGGISDDPTDDSAVRLEKVEWWTDSIEEFKRAQKALDLDITKTVMELDDEFGLISGDTITPGHWGKTVDGRIVLLDYGFTEDVAFAYY